MDLEQSYQFLIQNAKKRSQISFCFEFLSLKAHMRAFPKLPAVGEGALALRTLRQLQIYVGSWAVAPPHSHRHSRSLCKADQRFLDTKWYLCPRKYPIQVCA